MKSLLLSQNVIYVITRYFYFMMTYNLITLYEYTIYHVICRHNVNKNLVITINFSINCSNVILTHVYFSIVISQ